MPYESFSRIAGSIIKRVADWIAGQNEKHYLPREGDAQESVKVLRVSDRRREVSTHPSLQEVERGQYEDAVDPRQEEDALCEDHAKMELQVCRACPATVLRA